MSCLRPYPVPVSSLRRRGLSTQSHPCRHAEGNSTMALGAFAVPTPGLSTPKVKTPRVSERLTAGLMPKSVKSTDPPAGCQGVTATTGLRSACFCQPPACPDWSRGGPSACPPASPCQTPAVLQQPAHASSCAGAQGCCAKLNSGCHLPVQKRSVLLRNIPWVSSKDSAMSSVRLHSVGQHARERGAAQVIRRRESLLEYQRSPGPRSGRRILPQRLPLCRCSTRHSSPRCPVVAPALSSERSACCHRGRGHFWALLEADPGRT